jgi:hypothetical protein
VEDDRDEEDRRISAALRQFGRTARDLTGYLRTVGPNDIGTLLERNPDTGKIRFTEAMIGLIQHIKDFEPAVVFLDPLVELHTSEENDNTGLRAVIAQLRALAVRFNLAIVLAHHARKGTITPGDPDAVRGAGAIVGAARVVFTVCGMAEDEADNYRIGKDARKFYFRLDGAKMNYTPVLDAEWFERVPYALDNGEDVAAAVPWTPPRDTITTTLLEVVKEWICKGIDGDAYTFRSGSARSFSNLCKVHGVTTDSGVRELADMIKAAGFSEHAYKRANRVTAKGIRSPDGHPQIIHWDE